MITKWLKRGVITVVGVSVVGGLIFGKDVSSYVRSSAKSVRTVVKDSVPIEFELRRVRDMLEDTMPEMHALIRLIAQEEVEIAGLQVEITKNNEALDKERARIAILRDALAKPQARYCFAGQEYPRSYVKEDLANRFKLIKESEVVLEGNEKLLATRKKKLQATIQQLEHTRSRKKVLENQIESLASQYRLVKAASVGSQIKVDNSKLAKTEKLIAQIKKRLDVHERVLAHESKFVQAIPVDVVPEQDLLTQVDEYFQEKQQLAVVESQSPEPQQSLDN